jgi:hypothetical protein
MRSAEAAMPFTSDVRLITFNFDEVPEMPPTQLESWARRHLPG